MRNGAVEWASPDNAAFAVLSGDSNPMHTDEFTARRSLFGGCIAHGVSVVLWALEATPILHGTCPKSITFDFDSPVHAGDALSVRAIPVENGTRLIVSCGDAVVARVSLSCETTSPRAEVPAHAPPGVSDCVTLTPDEARNREGCEPLWLNAGAAQDRYPNLVSNWGPAPLAAILALTRIVGMRCPGARALFLQAKIELHDTSATALPWRVRKVHPATGRVIIDVGPGIVSGTLVAAFRPEPVVQPPFATLLNAVEKDLFRDWNALVVGGSRGLGELAAKLVCAGGGNVTVTGRRREDAQRVAGEITRGGGRATALALDLTRPVDPGLHGEDHTHLLFFATPPIRANNAVATFGADYARYSAIYVDALARFVRARSGSLRGVLYPSCHLVSNAPAGLEVCAAAKAAGELLCEELSAEYPGIRFHAPRLPRLATDQTASVIPAAFEDSVPVILQAVRALRRDSAGDWAGN